MGKVTHPRGHRDRELRQAYAWRRFEEIIVEAREAERAEVAARVALAAAEMRAEDGTRPPVDPRPYHAAARRAASHRYNAARVLRRLSSLTGGGPRRPVAPAPGRRVARAPRRAPRRAVRLSAVSSAGSGGDVPPDPAPTLAAELRRLGRALDALSAELRRRARALERAGGAS